MQFIAFHPGSATVPDGELKKLEALAKGLEERPGLGLEITGTADPALDRAAIGIRKLMERLIAMKQRERGRGSPKLEGLSTEDDSILVAELYEQQQDQIEKAVLPQPTEAVQKLPTVADMKQRLASAIRVDEFELRALARQRAEQVRDGLIEVGELAEERAFLLETDPTASGNEQIRSRLTIAAGS